MYLEEYFLHLKIPQFLENIYCIIIIVNSISEVKNLSVSLLEN